MNHRKDGDQMEEKKTNKKMISIRLSEDLIAKAKETAKAEYTTVTSLIERGLTAELNKR